MTLRRGPRQRLGQAIDAALDRAVGTPMRWGVDDCGLFFAGIVVEALGYDPAAPWRGRYSTERGAARVLGPRGIIGALAACARRYGWKKIDPRCAHVGDVGVARGRAGAACVVRDKSLWVGRLDRGFGITPAREVLMAWRIVPPRHPEVLARSSAREPRRTHGAAGRARSS